MPLVLKNSMEEQPACCLLCGSNPPKDASGKQDKCIHVEGLDVNWGDSVYICMECARLIGTLIDWVPEEEHRKAQNELRTRSQELAKLETRFGRYKQNVKKVVEGGKAKKEVARG